MNHTLRVVVQMVSLSTYIFKKEKAFIITYLLLLTFQSLPYVILRDNPDLWGNDKFEGYCVDMFKSITDYMGRWQAGISLKKLSLVNKKGENPIE